MINPRLIRENIEGIRKNLEIRNMKNAVDIEKLYETDKTILSLNSEIDSLREKRNKISKEVGELKKQKQNADALMEQVREINDKIKNNETELVKLDKYFREAILSVPNMLDESVPTGKDESDNKIVTVWGEKPTFDFTPRPHYDLGTDLDILDFERGVKLSGARFYVYKGLAAKLERAIISFMLDLHTSNHGYTEIFAPFIVNDESMTGTGQYPKFKDEYYRMEKDGLSLIPTAEVTLTNLYRDEILPKESLPRYITGQSSCFRREAGSAGKDTRGLIRVHQFQKVELVKFVEPETSFDELEKLTDNAETVLRKLNLHYRKVLLCSADTSAASAKTYDLEVWMPGLNRFVEISSCSNFLDYQSRRMAIRYKKDENSKTQLVHTLNGSGLAAGRTLAAIMENYQQKDGTIEIPEVLKKYFD